uniref:Uncharacterized protein n=1 Tax=Rhizophora mucronata TaxID=61149 RepID=A0A2P2PCY6_RHIMU
MQIMLIELLKATDLNSPAFKNSLILIAHNTYSPEF